MKSTLVSGTQNVRFVALKTPLSQTDRRCVAYHAASIMKLNASASASRRALASLRQDTLEKAIMTIGEKIKAQREAKGMSQHDLARLIDERDMTISLWERDKHLPALDRAKKLAAALDTSIDELTGE